MITFKPIMAKYLAQTPSASRFPSKKKGGSSSPQGSIDPVAATPNVNPAFERSDQNDLALRKLLEQESNEENGNGSETEIDHPIDESVQDIEIDIEIENGEPILTAEVVVNVKRKLSWVTLRYPLFSLFPALKTNSEMLNANGGNALLDPTQSNSSESQLSAPSHDLLPDTQPRVFAPRYYNWNAIALRQLNVDSLEEAANSIWSNSKPSRPTHTGDQGIKNER